MRKLLLALAVAGLSVVANLHASPYATSVVSYTPGTGINTNFVCPASALGAPSAVNQFGENTDPFNPPYWTNQIVSIGTNGSLTVRFDQPVLNLPNNPYGRDFIIFGNTGFQITNDFDLSTFEYIGDPATDGSLFGQNTDANTISVSRDGVNFYRLDPKKVPLMDNIFPTDGAGDFQKVVDPSLTAASFAGKTLTGIEALYGGAAGGSSYDISWAQDTNGNSVFLNDIQYVRIDVPSGKVEIDAITAVANPSQNTIFAEDFSGDPLAHGWKTYGNSNLFYWDPTNKNLRVTWDSSQTNSYFYMPLGTILGKSDDFAIGFDLYLEDIGAGPDINKPYSFEIAAGFLNKASASAPNFLRGTGVSSPDVAEFDFFRRDDFDPSVAAGFFSTNSQLSYGGAQDFSPVDLPIGITMHVTMNYTASNHTAVTTITTNGASIGQINPVTLTTNFTDYRVDMFSINSYSDYGAFGSSVLAHGVIDNLMVVVPLPPVQGVAATFAAGSAQMQINSQTNWNYVLERSGDLQTWTVASSIVPGNGGVLNLPDNNPPVTNAVYRVKAWRGN